MTRRTERAHSKRILLPAASLRILNIRAPVGAGVFFEGFSRKPLVVGLGRPYM